MTAIRVLHVDDEQTVAELTATHLERESERLEVLTATSPADGLSLLRDGDVDCVVSDFDMPGMDGIEFLETVREDHPDLPFVLFTGKGSEEVASDAISAGVTDYLQKETGTDQYAVLANRITNAVDHDRSRRMVERSQRRLRDAVDTLPHLLYVVDEQGTYLLANEALANFHDSTVEEIEGARVDDVLGPDIAERFRRRVAEVLDADESIRYTDVEVTDASGETHVFEPRLRPYEFGESDARSVLGIATDVTERTARERELRRHEAYLEESSDIVTVLDEEGTITYESPAVARVLGFEPGALIGRSAFDIIHPDDVEAVFETFTDLVADPGATVTVEFRFRNADDEWRWLEVHATNQLAHDAIDGIVANSRDITERKAREQALQRERDRLGEFASVVSHDLRAPLSVAAGRLALAREDCASEHLEPVADSLARMERIVDDVLWLSREGRDIGATEPVDLRTAAEAAWRFVSDESDGATLDVVEEGRCVVEADPDRFRQLLENLLRNAIEHGGPDVTVHVEPTASGFAVEDDGPGIPPAEREAVFDAGYSTSRSGTGFGLSIVERVAAAHGWDLRVTDGTNGGARIEVAGVAVPTDP